jgi:endonuclease I
MRGDLHHLFACKPGCNSSRRDKAYYDFADYGAGSSDECGKGKPHKFEPNHSKGAVARATLYFLLRYPREVNDAQREFEIERLPILIQWAQQSKPDLYEKHRNMTIYEKQGNRNPLIDYPEWVDKIDFRPGFCRCVEPSD